MLDAQRLARLGRALQAPVAPAGDADLPRARRRALGAFFTPAPLVEFVVAETLAARFARAEPRWRADGSPALIVLDPAAGDGRFLAAAGRWLAARAAERGHDPAAAARAIARRCLVGVERDPAFAAAARAALGAAVHCAEALLAPPADLPPADVVVGNPPYQRSIHLGRTDAALWAALRGRYAATSYREWDLYAAFLEQALAWARPGGEIGMVVPSRWLTAAFAAPLRRELAARAAVRALVDFGAEQLFAGATTYASVAFLTRAGAERVAVARWSGRRWRRGELPASQLGAAPWRLAVGARRSLLERLAARGPALGDVAHIVKGAGTNADPVFVVEVVGGARGDTRSSDRSAPSLRAGPDLLRARSAALDAEVDLEAGLVRPCLRGRDVVAWGRASGQVACLVPYDGARLIAAGELGARWPHAAAYLARCRGALEARERGRFRGDGYYCFGRPQNLAFLADPAPKVVVPDVARRGRALLDGDGALVLDSAYALRLRGGAPAGASLELLCALLNSPIVALWLRETGVQLRGGYVRMKTAYLRSLPLPPPATWAALAAGGRDVDLVRRSYGVAAADFSD